ncbi:MAG: protein disulfide isomerase family protein [Candidatus Bilamarchaeum sp.]|jgi:thiol-disulfide isomerase/thioredoxin
MGYKCEPCERDFGTPGALKSHKKDTHKILDPKPTSKHYGMYLAILVILMVGLYFVYNSFVPGKYDAFAKCLTEKGAKFYGASWCPHCKEQKEMFGNSMKYVNYIECATPDGSGQTRICSDANIKGYPTWEFVDGSKQSGKLTFEELSAKTNCKLKTEGG